MENAEYKSTLFWDRVIILLFKENPVTKLSGSIGKL